MKRRLVQINSVVGTGSTGRIADEIGKYAIRNGWDSYIFYGRYGNSEISKTIRIGKGIDINNHLIQTRLFDNHGLASIRATAKMLEEIEAIQPDVIHLHNLHGYYVNFKMLFEFINEKNIPTVWTLHDCWPITGHCAHFDLIGCEKWKKGCHSCPQKNDYPSSYLFDRSKKNYALKKSVFNKPDNLTLIPVSGWLNEILKESFLKNVRRKVIHNGLDLHIFQPRSNNEILVKYDLKNKFLILGVSNIWSPLKGFDDFLKLSESLMENEQIILVGLTKGQIKRLPENIIGIERTESVEELCELYSLADVFVNPTYQDNYPTVNLEAISCGTPVITYNTGGSPESLSKSTGYVVNKGDLHGLLQKIYEVKSLGKQHFSEACLKRAKSFFDKDVTYSKYIDLYQKIS